MYYPYLRARQFELIAIRELAKEDALGKVVPVLEPVRESFNNLELAHKVLLEENDFSYLVVNPLSGDVAGDNNKILDYLEEKDLSQYKPAFHFNDNSSYIKDNIANNKLSDCLLIAMSNFNNIEGFKELCKTDEISSIMLLEPNRNRSLDGYIKKLNKNYIRLDDLFENLRRNSDYLDVPSHIFTEEHKYYDEDKYHGFADFTALPSIFMEGGSLPRAVVIHLTYLNTNEEDQIWINHFTSDTNDSVANVQGKFGEAAQKAIAYYNREHIAKNSAIFELEDYLSDGRYPGLGIVKKISIKNHLLVVNQFLSENK